MVAVPPLTVTATSTTSDTATLPTGADAETPGAVNVSTTSEGCTLVSVNRPPASAVDDVDVPATATPIPAGDVPVTVP